MLHSEVEGWRMEPLSGQLAGRNKHPHFCSTLISTAQANPGKLVILFELLPQWPSYTLSLPVIGLSCDLWCSLRLSSSPRILVVLWDISFVDSWGRNKRPDRQCGPAWLNGERMLRKVTWQTYSEEQLLTPCRHPNAILTALKWANETFGQAF